MVSVEYGAAAIFSAGLRRVTARDHIPAKMAAEEWVFFDTPRFDDEPSLFLAASNPAGLAPLQ